MNRIDSSIRKGYRNTVLLLRLQAGFVKQKDFAEKTGISPQTVSEIESNKRFLSSPYALRIAEVLGCSLDDLFEPTVNVIRPHSKRRPNAPADFNQPTQSRIRGCS